MSIVPVEGGPCDTSNGIWIWPYLEKERVGAEATLVCWGKGTHVLSGRRSHSQRWQVRVGQRSSHASTSPGHLGPFGVEMVS